jgi:Heterokaryon incompatibility protein (HET)
MHWMPSFGKALCRFYIAAARCEEAVVVASTCYGYVRNEMVDHTPMQEAFQPALNNWVHWAEICGNIYVGCDQKYMARQLYAMTVADLKRFNWDSPFTLMRKSSYTHFSSTFQRKLENLGPDSDDEEDGDEYAEPPIPLQRRLKLAFIQPSADFTARVECKTLVVDIAKAPTYKALSYAWGGPRKVISYTREDGPPYAPDEESDNPNPIHDIVLVDGQETSIRETLFHALQQIREPNTAVAIWVDAICTNREEMKRRAAWTLRMRDIYKYADEVIVWLGKGDEETQKGMNFLHGFWEERPKLRLELGEYLFGPLSLVPWNGICKLLRTTWWTRIWTLQEFMVAKELQIQCGDKQIPWRCLQEFTRFVDLESKSYQLSEERHGTLRPIIRLVKARNEFICLREEYIAEFGFSLEKLWQATKTHESYDPRDKIFALLGMLDQTSAKFAPKINYDYCPCAVYSDMIIFRSFKHDLEDPAKEESQRLGSEILLGLEQGSEDNDKVEHIYTWESRRLEANCDGEKCGRRLKCFTDGIPEFPTRWSRARVVKHLNMMYDSYIDMKRTQRLLEMLTLTDTAKKEDGDRNTIKKVG